MHKGNTNMVNEYFHIDFPDATRSVPLVWIVERLNGPSDIRFHRIIRTTIIDLKANPRVEIMAAEQTQRAASIRFLAKSLASYLLRKHGESEAAKRVWD